MKKSYYVLMLLCFFSVSVIDVGRILSINITAESEFNVNPQAATPYTLHIGAWIIVAGDRPDHEGYYHIEESCNDVYNKILDLGFTHSNIYYLAADWDGSLPANADAESTLTNIEYAITNWAADKVGPSNALGVHLCDHGGYGNMGLPGPNLVDTDLNTYLNTLESATGMTRSLIIYEACHAGSFIDPLSKEGRIIITSTNIELGSAFSPGKLHTFFSEHFWAAVSMGYKLGYCFEYVTECVDIWGLGQKPLLDDNHDEIGHEVNPYTGDLPWGGDGYDAKDISLGEPAPVLKYVSLMKCGLNTYLPAAVNEIPIWVVVENTTEIDYVRAYFIPEGWEWPEPREDADGSSYYGDDDFVAPSFFDIWYSTEEEEGVGVNYSTSVDVLRNPELFDPAGGSYKIIYEAKALNGSVAKPLPTTIIRNAEGEAPQDRTPPTIQITNPYTDLNITESMDFTVKADDDQALEKVLILLDGEVIEEKDMPDYYPYPEVKYSFDIDRHTGGEKNLTAIAVDKAGNVKQTTVTINIIKSSIPGFDIPITFVSSFLCIIVILVKYQKSRLN